MVKRKTAAQGQTLIEVMIALSVATIAFSGIMALLSKSFFYDRVIADQVTATYLASEGIEIAKNVIDHDLPSGNAWGSCLPAGDFMLDYAADCSNFPNYNGNVALKFDPTTERYGYAAASGAAATVFTREIRVTKNVSTPDQITVQSIVRWSTGPAASQSVDLEDVFYNWAK